MKLQLLEARLKYKFQDLTLLDRALTHKSYSYEVSNTLETGEHYNYESLEFLGDSILGLVISEFLYLTYPEMKEGDLSKLRSYLVSTRQLHALSSVLGLGEYLKLSRGEAKTGGRKKRAILADLFESVVAAIYLDGDLDPVRDFILNQYEDQFEKVALGDLDFFDHKSELQELLHRRTLPGPVYQVVDESGPDHAKEFIVIVSSEGESIASGKGRSKKEAEQHAARDAIRKLKGMDPRRTKKEPE